MKVVVNLFGAFRDLQPQVQLELDLPEGARVADLREALADYARTNWSGFRPGLLACSAFASESAVLRDSDALPANGPMAVLPPVSGG